MVENTQTLLQVQPRTWNESRILYMRWRIADLFSSVFGCFGLISATADYEVGFSDNRTHSNCKENTQQIYRWLTLLFTLISIFFLILRHSIKYRWKNKIAMSVDKKSQKKIKRLNKNLILELIALLIFPYPYLTGQFRYMQPVPKIVDDVHEVEVCYNYSEFLYVLMFLRLLFLFRVLFNFTPYQDDHARYYCSRNGTKANVRFSVKCMMKTHPFILIYCFSFPSFFLLGIFLRVFERPFSDYSGQNYSSYQNAVWNCAITMSTVGYGELYPTTVFGRITVVLCTMWGAFMFSMIVFTFQILLEFNSNQNQAFVSIKHTRAAARVVTACMVYNVIKNKYGYRDIAAKKQMKKIMNKLKLFKNVMKNIQDVERNTDEDNPNTKITLIHHQLSILDEKLNILLKS